MKTLSIIVASLLIGTISATPAVADYPPPHSAQVVPYAVTEDTTGSLAPQGEDALDFAQEYVSSMRQRWQAEVESAFWKKEHERLTEEVESARIQAERLEADASEAMERYEEARQVLASWARDVRSGEQSPVGLTAEALMRGPDSMREVTDAQKADELAADFVATKNAQAQADKQAAETMLSQAQAQRSESESLLVQAQGKLSDSQRLLDSAAAAEDESYDAWTKAWGSIPLTRDEEGNVSLGTDILNTAVVKEWNNYMASLKNSGVELPTADQLSDSQGYPEGMSTPNMVNVLDTTGVAMVDGVIVPSKESAQRTQKALSLLGEPYKKGGSGKDGWSCTAFTNDLLGINKKTPLEETYELSGRQNRNILDSAPGDIVFYADPSSGIHHSGVFVFGGLVVSASASSNAVAVEPLAVDALASIRPLADVTLNAPAPLSLPGSLPWECGGIDSDDDNEDTAGGWTTPFPKDSYSLGVEYGDKNDKGDTSQGLEFLVDEPSPVRASFDGIVTSVKSKKKTSSVTIRHSGMFSTTYTLLSDSAVSEGAKVKAGAVVGVSGTKGISEKGKSGVVVVIESDKETIDPRPLFFPEREGKYANGRIPHSALCQVSTGGLLRCDAARAFEMLNAAYRDEFNANIAITDSYRSFEGQVRCRQQKGDLCATPGTSNHGWGLALDLGGGINNFGTAQHEWMRENVSKYGWKKPDWSAQGGSKPEAWHWEYHATK